MSGSKSNSKTSNKKYDGSNGLSSNSKGNVKKGTQTPAPQPQQMNPISTTNPIATYIPSYLSELVPELNSYELLLEAEKKVDLYLARKKIDINQNIAQWSNSNNSAILSRDSDNSTETKFLRVFISNIAENQPWQDSTQELSNASWTMRIEGRLLDSQDVTSTTRTIFSSYFQGIAVDFKKQKKNASSQINAGSNEDQDSEMHDVEMSNISNQQNLKEEIVDAVEWNYDPKNPVQFDGLDIKRSGSENLDCTVTLQLKNVTGSTLEYSPQLASIIGLSQGSIQDAIYYVYKYLLINGLLINDLSLKNNTDTPTNFTQANEQTNGEKTIIQIDDLLSELILSENSQTNNLAAKPSTMNLAEFLSLINKHVSPMKPIKIDYTVRVDKASTYGEVVFDVAVPNPITNANQKNDSENLVKDGVAILNDINSMQTKMKSKLDELNYNSSLLHLQLNESAKKYQFFNKISENPVLALQEYIESSSNALKVLSGDEGYNEDMVRRYQFYKDNEDILFENLGVLLANGRM